MKLGTTTTTFGMTWIYLPLTVVVTGGTGSFGQALIRFLISQSGVGTIRCLSRDEFKQSEMAKEIASPKLRYFIGDVRDKERLQSAFRGADIVIHAAAMKQVPACEYNPKEAVRTNIKGTLNVIEACIDQQVDKALLISSDKAVDPVNLYGATKMVAEKVWLNANNLHQTKFAFSRWGNVVGSRGSVIPLFRQQAKQGKLTLTHKDMTRFWITLDEAVEFAWQSVQIMKGGEVYIPNLRSSKVLDIAKSIAPKAKIEYVGIRQGEKLHETLGEGYKSNDPKRLMSLKEVYKLLRSKS